jgi:hypothetical protein
VRAPSERRNAQSQAHTDPNSEYLYEIRARHPTAPTSLSLSISKASQGHWDVPSPGQAHFRPVWHPTFPASQAPHISGQSGTPHVRRPERLGHQHVGRCSMHRSSQLSAVCSVFWGGVDPRSRVPGLCLQVTAAIVTCGGLCPGLNDVVQNIVYTLDDYGVPAGQVGRQPIDSQ